ncbi:MAG: DUF423 domain-containing protein [Alicyclobacillaceae bacterium]|jgi:uncharacterized membrane protein YgdD (TMEM256/DUF423 family)|uniref:DUF423 domain-containing protein n=1 Tax=Alicyclobacillus sp. SP_1 TaxID=2942475 RepID=UPI002157988F|nr:DUF423 domain-containing protein [Alicyclobacillus sp. SP_1]MCY0888641.1 DUF423 domain-containing protein [Alicyclobacillaceae bacterium]MCY0896648.1 DUF423 domain-containing protein [Alicyclobacillaceae bacterium]
MFILLGSVLGFFSVALGAFAAHALRRRVSAEQSAVFATGAQYEMYHALALIAIGLWSLQHPSSLLTAAAWFFVAGIVFFSGSLYVLVWTGMKRFGAVTPIGGLCFLVGWALLAIRAWHLL